jgi:hypothetical protein
MAVAWFSVESNPLSDGMILEMAEHELRKSLTNSKLVTNAIQRITVLPDQ